MKARLLQALALLLLLIPTPALAQGLEAKGDYFPIGVWLQDPKNAPKYKELGINVYIGLWEGPTEAQLTALEKAGITVACDQNPLALEPRWNKTIVGWLQQDEPDNAQELPNKKGYGPPITPDAVVDTYKKLKAGDKLNRPVMLNLGQGVAWDAYYGRGVRTNHPEDYAKYALGGDIVSFDIYPANHDRKEVAGKLSFVGEGVTRLLEWTHHKKPVWACIETTPIDSPKRKPTPEQIRAEAWMAIIHGARGIIYFAHEFHPKFVEAGILADPTIAAAVKKTNAEIAEFAAIINDGLPVEGTATDAQSIWLLARRHPTATVLFASSASPGPDKVALTLAGLKGKIPLEVVGESRTVDSTDGKFTDSFSNYETHIYRLKTSPPPGSKG